MTKQKVTITLGRAGQVVKRAPLDVGNDVRQFHSGSKRSIRDRLGNGESSSYSTKRQRGVSDALRPDKQIGKHDLRLKLQRKKSLQREQEELRQIDLREKLQRPLRPPPPTFRVVLPPQSRPPVSSIPRHRSPPRSTESSLFLEPSRRPYSSWNLNDIRSRSPDRMLRPSRGMPPPRISSQMREVPPRPIEASRHVQVRETPLHSYRPIAPAPIPQRPPLESSLPVRQHQSSTSIMLPSARPVEEPTTLSGLLQSLGLSKYHINFRAEEVDLATLKQMGDIDLKEMGIPMGPRRKILLAIKSSSIRRPP